SAVEPVLFRPLPYPRPERLVMVWDTNPDGTRADVTFGTARELAARVRSLDALALLKTWRPTLTGPAEPERLEGQRVSAAFFRVLGVAPALGRAFEESEDRLRGAKVAVLSDGLFRRRFGADRSVLGRTITLDGDDFQVIGVMPERF